MTQTDVELFITSLGHVEREESMGYIFYFVSEPHYVPFVSIALRNNEHDTGSDLDREGVFRVNIGVSNTTFKTLFPEDAAAQSSTYTDLNVFMPHPEYAAQSFICILNPAEENEARTKEFIQEAYALAVDRMDTKKRV